MLTMSGVLVNVAISGFSFTGLVELVELVELV
jgi:hypothetical protein